MQLPSCIVLLCTLLCNPDFWSVSNMLPTGSSSSRLHLASRTHALGWVTAAIVPRLTAYLLSRRQSCTVTS